MLRYVPPIFTAELLEALLLLEKGETVVLADSMFPAKMPNGPPVIEFGGGSITKLLESILSFLSIYSPVVIMKPDEGEGKGNPEVGKTYKRVIKNSGKHQKIKKVGRQEFYELAEKAVVIIRTRDATPWSNVILTRGLLAPRRMTTMLSPRCLKELHLLGHGQGIVVCEEESYDRLAPKGVPFIRVEEALPDVLNAVLTYIPVDTFPGFEPVVSVIWAGGVTIHEVTAMRTIFKAQWPQAPHLKAIEAEQFAKRVCAASLVIVATIPKEIIYPPVLLFKGNKIEG